MLLHAQYLMSAMALALPALYKMYNKNILCTSRETHPRLQLNIIWERGRKHVIPICKFSNFQQKDFCAANLVFVPLEIKKGRGNV